MMKRNILRAAVAASILGISGVAFADDANVPFEGVIAKQCTLTPGSIVQGTLALDGSDRITAHPTDNVSATLGEFAFVCSGTATAELTVNDPTTNNPTAVGWESGPGTFTRGAMIYNDNLGAIEIANTTGTVTASTQPTGTYYVSMWVQTAGQDVPDGTYGYMVIVNIVDS